MTRAEICAAVEGIQSDWPEDTKFKVNGESVYFHFPSFLYGAFPRLRAEDAVSLSAFCRFFADSVFWQDKIVDGTHIDEPTATISLRVMLMQAEAYRLLHQLFAPNARFWVRFRGYLLEHVDAILLERRFATRELSFRECTDETRKRIVVGKNGLARTIAAALVELSGDEHLYEPLVDVVNQYNQATQLWDDLSDWKDDLRRAVPTAVVRRLVAEPPGELDDAQWQRLLSRLARELYYKGHAHEVISMILASLRAAESHADVLPELGLYEEIGSLRHRCATLDHDIASIVTRNVELARARATAELV